MGPGNNEGISLGASLSCAKGHVPPMCSLILHMTHHHHHLLNHEPTFNFWLPKISHILVSVLIQIKVEADGVLSVPFRCLVGNEQQVNYTERYLFTLPSVCLCVFSLIDFLALLHWTCIVQGARVFEVMWKNCEIDNLINASKFCCLPYPVDTMIVWIRMARMVKVSIQ